MYSASKSLFSFQPFQNCGIYFLLLDWKHKITQFYQFVLEKYTREKVYRTRNILIQINNVNNRYEIPHRVEQRQKKKRMVEKKSKIRNKNVYL